MRILIADDDDVSRVVLEALLTRDGHEAARAALDRLAGLFGRFGVYAELQRDLSREQEAQNEWLRDEAERLGLDPAEFLDKMKGVEGFPSGLNQRMSAEMKRTSYCCFRAGISGAKAATMWSPRTHPGNSLSATEDGT